MDSGEGFMMVEYGMRTAANDDRIVYVKARLQIAGEEAARLFNERKVMTGEIRSIESGSLAEMVVELRKTNIAVYSARESEMVRGDDFVAFLPMEADHRGRPDAYVGGLIEATVNGEYVDRAVLEEVLGLAVPVKDVAQFRELMAKLSQTQVLS